MTKATIVCALCSIVAFVAKAQEATKPDAPTAALVAYADALKKGDIEAAKKLTATFDKIPAEALDQVTAKYSDGAKAGKIALKTVPASAKAIEDCAVVTLNNSTAGQTDYDPAYLIKQGETWKVLLKLTQWEHPMFDLSADQKKRFAELDGEKARLNGR